ncbi:MAG: hypothetical protein R3C14_09525 [Caldilineaceae bacterium]
MMQRCKRLISLILLMTLLAGACQPVISSLTAAQHSVAPHLALVGHVPGSALSIAIEGDYAYVGFSYELVVLDLTDRTKPQWVTALPLPANDLAIAGQHAAVVGVDGFAWLDIAEPATPKVLGQLTLPITPSGLALTERYAYVVASNQFYILDLTDGQQPQVLATLQLLKRLEGVAVAAGTAYVTADRGLYIVDVTDPQHPTQVSLLAGSPADGAPVVIASRLYFGGGGQIQIVDITELLAPRLIGQTNTPDWVSELAADGDYLYLANGAQGLRVLESIAQDSLVARSLYSSRGLMIDVAVQDGYVYSIDCDEGLRIFDATDPTNLIPVGTFNTLGTTLHMACTATDVYVMAGWNSDLHCINTETSGQLGQNILHISNGVVYDLTIKDHYLYILRFDGLHVIDLAEPGHPRVMGSYVRPDLWHVATGGQYIYLSDSKGNLWVVDGVDPAHLVELAYYPLFGHVGGMALSNGNAYIPDATGGVRLLAVDANGELRSVGLYPLPYIVNSIALYTHLAYLAVGQAGIQIMNVADPVVPELVGHIDTPGDALDIVIEGHYALVADGPAGLRVFDLTDPVHPSEIAAYVTPDYARQVIYYNGIIYVADWLGGLYLFTLASF